MPKVGKQKFPYTSGGVQKAQKHAKATGQKVDMSGYKKGGVSKSGPKQKKKIKHKELKEFAHAAGRRGGKAATRILLKKVSKLKKKGGVMKQKYHHGGRVMGGQKKPKNQKC